MIEVENTHSKSAVLLVRVSTNMQENKPQLEDLTEYAKSMGFFNLHIIETKESGLVDFERKIGSNQLFDFVNSNPEYSVVFTTEISRLGRRQSILHQMKEWFIKHRIQLYVKDTGYALLDPDGKISIAGEMMFTLYGFFAESELKQKKDRFSRAKKSLFEMGLSISGKTLFGYERIKYDAKRTTLIPHKENAEIVKTIFDWYINGIDIYSPNVSIRIIAFECLKRGFPKYTHSKRNINKLLKEGAYLGEKITNNKRKNIDYIEGDHSSGEKYIITNNKIKYPVIIDQYTFDCIQTRLRENNSKVEKSNKHITILSRLIVCKICGSHLTANYRKIDNKDVDTYRCSGRSLVNKCQSNMTLSMKMIDSAIWCLIKTDLKILSNTITTQNPDKDSVLFKENLLFLEERIDIINSEINSYLLSLKAFNEMKNISTADFISSMQNKMIQLDKEKGQIEIEISKLKTNIKIQNQKLHNIDQIINENLELIESSKDSLKKYINLYVERIETQMHNSKFTVLRVFFKIHGNLNFKKSFDGELDDAMLLVIDKRVTQKIKLFKSKFYLCHFSNRFHKGNKIIIVDYNKRKNNNYGHQKVKLNLELLSDPEFSNYFEPIKFERLPIYL